MDWLEQHIRTFVLPGIKTLIDAKGEDVAAVVPHNFDGIRPAKCCKYPEAGLVMAALSSFAPPSKNFVNGLSQESDGLYNQAQKKLISLNRLREILTNCDPNIWSSRHDRYGLDIPSDKQWYDVIHTLVKNSWRSLKASILQHNKILILAGRDVWVWEILARRDGVPTIYDPRISRLLCRDRNVLAAVCKSWGIDFNRAVVFDTGFAGSIWRALCSAVGTKLGNIMLSTSLTEENGNSCQIFPKHKGARAKALTIEYLPKYYKTGTVRDEKPVQWLAPLEEFIQATALTIWFWHYRSPKFVETPKKPGFGRRRRYSSLGSPLFGVGSSGPTSWALSNFS